MVFARYRAALTTCEDISQHHAAHLPVN